MRYGSLFSGIEAASVAWKPLGWKCEFVAEIEPFPSAVLAHHYPDVPNLGDVTQVNWQEVKERVGSLDVLVFGSPCQSFSVAGKRLGLDDPRGNLALVALGIVDVLRPRWFIFENVPGLLSSGGGRDFGAFLGTVDELGYSASWRVLDAQYVRTHSHPRAVPQRRRRVFVVGHLGDWRRAAAVLFERESLSGHPAPRREAGKTAPTIPSRSTAGGGLGTDFDCDGGLIADVASTLNAHYGDKQGLEDQHINQGAPLFVAHSLRADDFDASEDGTGRGTPLVPIAFAHQGGETLSSHQTPAIAIQERAVSENPENGPGGKGFSEDGSAYTLEARNKVQAVAFNAYQRTVSDVPGPLTAGDDRKLERGVMTVRRLTPRECERLQGFPDVRKTVIFEVCHSSDHTPSDAPAGTPSPRSQRSVSTVGDGGCPPSVRNAEQDSSTSHPDPALPVLAHVLIDSERGEVQLLSRGRLLWSASSAGEGSLSPLPIPVDVFARLAAHTITTLVNATHSGRAASPASMTASTHPLSGSAYATVSGPEIVALASDAVKCGAMASDLLKSITSAAGPSSPTSAQTLATSSCCVVAAIASSIPVEILPASSYALSIEVVRGYTDIPWRNKPHAPDGPRYKALGNSMAVNVMSWIGQRIALVEEVIREHARRAA